jgi:hypothetical protein
MSTIWRGESHRTREASTRVIPQGGFILDLPVKSIHGGLSKVEVEGFRGLLRNLCIKIGRAHV